jgi:hypothetical protein
VSLSRKNPNLSILAHLDKVIPVSMTFPENYTNPTILRKMTFLLCTVHVARNFHNFDQLFDTKCPKSPPPHFVC